MAQRERRQVPEVRRPRGVAWRSLQAEGLVWEAQVFLVGADFDLAARLIVTRERVALARGGGIILEAARNWFRPEPRLLPDGNVLLTITPDTGASASDGAEMLLLRMREGWHDASHLVTLLGGNRPRRPSKRRVEAEAMPLVPPVAPANAVDPLDWARPATRPAGSKSGAGEPVATAPRHDPPWSRSRREQAPIDVPVAAAGAAAAATTTSEQASQVLPPPQAPAAHGRHYDWNMPPEEVVPSRGSRRRRGWMLRVGGLLALILVAVVVAALAGNRESGERTLEGARITPPAGSGMVADTASATATAASVVTATPQSGGADRDLPAAGNEETAVALGVGSDLSPTSTSVPVEAPPAIPTDAVPTATPVDDGEAAAQVADETEIATATIPPPTETPLPPATATAVVATATAAAVATTEAATSPPLLATIATATATPESLATATMVPPTPTTAPATATMAPATPTTAPATATAAPPTPTPAPTAEPTLPPATATAAPTETPEPEPANTPAPTAEPSFPTQVASVSEAGYTAPAFETGAFRLTVESTMKGSSLPSLGLPANPYGDWLVAVVYVHNWSDAPANLVMQNFGLVTANPTVSFMPLDSGTSLVGSTLGFELPLASTDSVVFMPGEGHRIGLLFTADPLGSGFSLEYGPAVVGLESSLVASPNATELGPPPPAPDLLEATVTDVVDGDTIMVDIDGVETTVTYIGVRAPAPDACYGPEATAANAAIVAAGDAVYLEREATNESEDGALLRDVWIDLDGASVLVANELAAAGAVDVLSDTVNDRFTAWLEVTVANAAFQGLGLWGACGGEVGETNREAAVAVRTIPRGSIALLPRPPALSG